MILETERLILRNLQESDLEAFHAYRSNAEICKYQSFEVFTIEDSKAFIESQKDAKFGTPGEWMQVGLEWQETGKLIGDIALKPDLHEPRTVEIGATIDIPYRKKGFVVEAFTRMFEYLFTETETHRIIGVLDVENAGSLRLVENLNFRREGEFKKSFWDTKTNQWRDEYFYAFLKEDWETGRKRNR